MLVRNENFAGHSLMLRSSGAVVVFDQNGTADVPDPDGEFLVKTPGWTLVNGHAAPAPRPAVPALDKTQGRAQTGSRERKPPPRRATPRTLPEPVLKPDPDVGPFADDEPTAPGGRLPLTPVDPARGVVKRSPAPVPDEQAAAAAEAEAEDTGPDLDTMNKAQLLECARAYDIKIDRRWSRESLRDYLDKQIYGDEEDEE